MSSLGSTVGGAMADAVRGAAIGSAFNSVRQHANDAIEMTHEWAAYAKSLESEIRSLESKLVNSNEANNDAKNEAINKARESQKKLQTSQEHATNIVNQYNSLASEYNKVNGLLSASKQEVHSLNEEKNIFRDSAKDLGIDCRMLKARLLDNVKYGKAMQVRLRQMEKALQHSSADKASLRAVYAPYKALVEKLGMSSELPPDLKESADLIWNAFMNGEDLTVDEDVKKIIDEGPAPVKNWGIMI